MGSVRRKRPVLLRETNLIAVNLLVQPPDSPDLGTDERPRLVYAEGYGFKAGTMILMADGTQRPIEEIGLDDRVAGRRGRLNRVTGCGRRQLGPGRLYAINGRRPFVTAGQPFLTTEGWKAFDPTTTWSPDLAPAALALGDCLCRGTARAVPRSREAMPPLLFVQSTAMLHHVAAVNADPETPLFNLVLDGDRSCVADGWIVGSQGDGD